MQLTTFLTRYPFTACEMLTCSNVGIISEQFFERSSAYVSPPTASGESPAITEEPAVVRQFYRSDHMETENENEGIVFSETDGDDDSAAAAPSRNSMTGD